MSGLRIIQWALDEANSADNEGNGYTVRIRTRSGAELEGAVHTFKRDYLVLQLWERPLYNGCPRAGDPTEPTKRLVYVDPDVVETIEILW